MLTIARGADQQRGFMSRDPSVRSRTGTGGLPMSPCRDQTNGTNRTSTLLVIHDLILLPPRFKPTQPAAGAHLSKPCHCHFRDAPSRSELYLVWKKYASTDSIRGRMWYSTLRQQKCE